MDVIALEKLDLDTEQLDTIRSDCQSDPNRYNGTMLIKWRNRSVNNTRQVLEVDYFPKPSDSYLYN